MNDPTSQLSFDDPASLWLELPDEARTQSWQACTGFIHPTSRWRAYLNHLALTVLLSWVQEDFDPHAALWPPVDRYPLLATAAKLLPFWELVNGTALVVNNQRWVLLPSEANHTDSLQVPQEWVDIPDWSADYYLGVQLDLDRGWLRVWGYATHYQFKTIGQYDPQDRSYVLVEENLSTDLGGFWAGLAGPLTLQEPVRAPVTPLSPLPCAQAHQLLERLGEPRVTRPRLEVPFTLWGALLSHDGWRQDLYERRQGLRLQWSVRSWLTQVGVSALARQAGWAVTMLAAAEARDLSGPLPVFSRTLAIAERGYELRVLQPREGVWRFQLRSALWNGRVPAGVTLRLLTEDLQRFPHCEIQARTATEELYVEVALDSGEGLIWEVEPTPQGYTREILRF
ncbi:DUF1822 family protein [Anthocerotibacter panamensis]|uniref:DUF1822 family protein n=1 Tax=Anthocerotibacter panamensis TaxID=2857077 RepID=UPI001C402178|nr:DUF1822 family protein [Anthocerotibacter panamensis]